MLTTTALIPMFNPALSEDVVESVVATLRAGWISEGRRVKEFESAFASRFGLDRALALNSGTAALHLAMVLAKVGPGDEVITPAQTFVATALAPMYVGATPVFVDIQKNTPNIDPDDLRKRITSRTKAIIVVHYGGYPSDMDEITKIAAEHNLAVIEDAAHALGATYKGRAIGSLSDFSIFSFQAIKQITTGDGGMLVCRRVEDHAEAYRRRWFGIDRANRKPSEVGQPEWDITELGFKYHMNDIAASMGLAQLRAFPESHARREELNTLYRARLGDVSGIRLLDERRDRQGSNWLFTIRVQRRLEFIRAVRSRGVEAAVWHRRIDHNSILGGLRADLPNQEAFDAEQVSLPLRSDLTDDDVETILAATSAGW